MSLSEHVAGANISPIWDVEAMGGVLMLRNVGRCVPASMVFVLAAATFAHADAKPGDRITAENVETVKDLISPGLAWCIRHGWPITIVGSQRIEWPRAYKEATEKYAAQVRLLVAEGLMRDAIDQFRAALARRGIIVPAEIVADGHIQRCDGHNHA